jgi:predicted NBD/HSP70 family sugar kinase
MALRGTNQGFGRPYNRRIVLETIRLHAPVTRADIAARVGLTPQTVANIVREIEEQGFIVSRRAEPKGRGYPAATLELNPEGGFAIGVHVTPLGLEAGLINLAGAVIARVQRDLPRVDPDTAFREIEAMVGELGEQRPHGRMLGVGLAMPGPFGVESMSFVGPTTLEGWKGFPVRQALATATGLPAFLEVDLAAAAHGERLYGAGRDFRDFYYLYFGVGLGGSMVHDGAALRGAWGNAGEIGHMPVVADGDLCPCGNRGCLERYVSLEAWERRARVIGETAWIAEVAPLLRTALVTIENLFDPETIVLGGIAPKPLLMRLAGAVTPLPNSVAARSDRRAPRVTLSPIGQDAVLLGAAALAVSGVLSPRFGMMFAEGPRRAARDPLIESTGARA